MDMDAKPPESLRLFYALWPDDATRAALLRLQTPLQGRKTNYQNFHLTLAFLDRQPATLLPVLQDILANFPKPDLPLVLDRIGYFTQQRLAWASMHAVPDTLVTLQRNLMQMLLQRHISLNPQTAFKPHVTLARNTAPPPDLPFESIAWHANQIVLVQSTTEADAIVYRILASC